MLRKFSALVMLLPVLACGSTPRLPCDPPHHSAVTSSAGRPRGATSTRQSVVLANDDAALEVARARFPDAFGGSWVDVGIRTYTPLTVCEDLPDPRELPVLGAAKVREHLFEAVACTEAVLIPLVSLLVRDRNTGAIYAIPAGTRVGFDHGEKLDADDPEVRETAAFLRPERLVRISAAGDMTEGSAEIRLLRDGRAAIAFDEALMRGDRHEAMLVLR